jgi:hypothetical protein
MHDLSHYKCETKRGHSMWAAVNHADILAGRLSYAKQALMKLPKLEESEMKMA